MRILVCNDDGIDAPGIKVLERVARVLSKDVWVVAPETQQSAASHSLTLHRPLRLRKISRRRYAVNGTPTDCVFLAFNKILADGLPDLVLSGVNDGPNVGEDVTYSGTIAAAMEATLFGAPAVAFSQAYGDGRKHQWATAEQWAGRLLPMLIERGWPARVLINVNFPDLAAADVRGIRVVRQGLHALDDTLEERIDPRGAPYYWIWGAIACDRQRAARYGHECDRRGLRLGDAPPYGSHSPTNPDMAARGHRMIGSMRETNLIAPLVGGTLMATVLLGVSACAALPFSLGPQEDDETFEANSAPAVPQFVAAPQERMPPPFEVSESRPALPMPRDKPALLLTVAAGDTLNGIAHRHGVPARTVIALNDLTHPYWLLTETAARPSQRGPLRRSARRAAGGNTAPRPGRRGRNNDRDRSAGPRGPRNGCRDRSANPRTERGVRSSGSERPACGPCGTGVQAACIARSSPGPRGLDAIVAILALGAGTARRCDPRAAAAHAQHIPLADRGPRDLPLRLEARRQAQ